jgi:hypothetical protein
VRVRVMVSRTFCLADMCAHEMRVKGVRVIQALRTRAAQAARNYPLVNCAQPDVCVFAVPALTTFTPTGRRTRLVHTCHTCRT